MSLGNGKYLFIAFLLLVLAGGCTAPPQTMVENPESTPELMQPTAPPTATPAAVLDPSYVIPATPYATGTSRPQGEPTPASATAQPETVGYKTIYSETIHPQFTETAMIVEVTQAPLIITAKITPETVTRSVVSQYGSKDFSVVYTRPSDLAWFECTVRNAGTGEIILQDGYGRGYTQNTNLAITIRRTGVYHITFGGNFVRAEVRMQLPETGILTEPIN